MLFGQRASQLMLHYVQRSMDSEVHQSQALTSGPWQQGFLIGLHNNFKLKLVCSSMYYTLCFEKSVTSSAHLNTTCLVSLGWGLASGARFILFLGSLHHMFPQSQAGMAVTCYAVISWWTIFSPSWPHSTDALVCVDDIATVFTCGAVACRHGGRVVILLCCFWSASPAMLLSRGINTVDKQPFLLHYFNLHVPELHRPACVDGCVSS